MSWGYNRFAKPKVVPQKINDATIPARLDAVINNPAVSAGDKQFCESLKQGWNKYGSLTGGQYGAFQKCEMRYDASAIAANAGEAQKRQEWINNFDSEKRTILNVCAQYYSKTPYFKDIADKVILDPTFIPSEKQYNAMCGNKYAQRLLENIKTPPKFAQGDVVVIRETTRRTRWDVQEVPHVILEIDDVVGPTRGSRIYTLLPIGGSDKVTYSEKDLKKYRPQESDELPRANKNNEEVPF